MAYTALAAPSSLSLIIHYLVAGSGSLGVIRGSLLLSSLRGEKRISTRRRGFLQMHSSHLACLHITLLQDLDQTLVFVVGAELVLQRCLRCAVHDALSSVPCNAYQPTDSSSVLRCLRCCLLVGHHDLEARNDLGKRGAAVCPPLCQIFGGVDEDDEVLLSPLVEDLVLLSVSLRHSEDLELDLKVI